MKKIFSIHHLSHLIISLLLAMLLMQCNGCETLNANTDTNEAGGGNQQQEPSTQPPSLTPITDEMIAAVENITDGYNYTFLLDKLRALKDSQQNLTVDINEHNNGERRLTALHYAVYVGNPHNMIQALLERGAQIDSKDFNGYTPLHLAVIGNKSSVIDVLVTKGASIESKNNQGYTPIDVAWELRIAGSSNENIFCSLIKNASKISKEVINEKYDNAGYSGTLLHYAIFWKYNQLIAVLIEKGADVTIQDSNGRKPLDLPMTDEIKEIFKKHGYTIP